MMYETITSGISYIISSVIMILSSAPVLPVIGLIISTFVLRVIFNFIYSFIRKGENN